ncbi:MAG: Gfo/Idh/MocA family oxidoreductase [Pseudomonadota bacterium]|nr:Gfo/Idh/MocA family oxidoreductase [Pseudomonadota bacterium]
MSAIGIIGAGFGLYGYLPALIEVGEKKIILPARYKDKFSARSELQMYAGYVQWVSDERVMLEMVDSIVLALPPGYQLELVKKLIHFQNVKNLLLEKPLAVSPGMSSQLIDELVNSKKRFRIGYNFRFTSWRVGIFEYINSITHAARINRLYISWNFLAPHYRNDELIWKRFNSSGGGALRFYGIHLIALLAEYGYTEVLFSKKFGSNPDEVAKWEARFSGENLPICEILVDSKTTKSQFMVSIFTNSKKTNMFNLLDPFDCNENSQAYKGQDKRLPYLVDLCRSLFDDSGMIYVWYKNTIELWRRVEDVSTFKIC